LGSSPSAALIPVAPVFTNTERLALAGFLAGYSGLTREAYERDLRHYTSWCHQHHLRLFQPAGPTSSTSPATWTAAMDGQGFGGERNGRKPLA